MGKLLAPLPLASSPHRSLSPEGLHNMLSLSVSEHIILKQGLASQGFEFYGDLKGCYKCRVMRTGSAMAMRKSYAWR